MIDFRKTVKSDIAKIKIKDIFKDNPDVRLNVLRNAKHSMAYTFLDQDGGILAIVGYTPLHPRGGELWSVTSDLTLKYPLAFHKKCLECLEIFVANNRLKRVQMVVKAGYYQGTRWALALGFSFEGTLKAYGYDGSDYLMMGRVY